MKRYTILRVSQQLQKWVVCGVRLLLAATGLSVPLPVGATTIVLDLYGHLARDVSVINRTASEPASTFDAFGFFSLDAGTRTTIAAGTPFTAQLRFELEAIPVARDASAVLGEAFQASFFSPNSAAHISAGTMPWVTASLSVAGFNFANAPRSGDAPAMEPNTLVTIRTPLQQKDVLIYGNDRASPNDSQVYAAASSRSTAYDTIRLDSQVGPVEFRSVGRFGSFETYLNRYFSDTGSGSRPAFFDPSAGVPTQLNWTDDVVSNDFNTLFPDYGFVIASFTEWGYLSALDSAGVFQTTANFAVANFLFGDLLVERAQAALDVPTPAPLALILLGVVAVWRSTSGDTGLERQNRCRRKRERCKDCAA